MFNCNTRRKVAVDSNEFCKIIIFLVNCITRHKSCCTFKCNCKTGLIRGRAR